MKPLIARRACTVLELPFRIDSQVDNFAVGSRFRVEITKELRLVFPLLKAFDDVIAHRRVDLVVRIFSRTIFRGL